VTGASYRTALWCTPTAASLPGQSLLLLQFACPLGQSPDELRTRMCISCNRRSGVARDTPLRSIVCGPCWFASSGETTASELVGRPATPATELPPGVPQWLRAVRSSSWFRARRVDSARRLLALCDALARHADWEDLTTWPTWDRLMDSTGWSRSTMSAWLAELLRLGFLLRVEGGSTPQYRPMALAHVEGNRAAVYQLRVPAQPLPAHTTAAPATASIRTPTNPSNQDLSRDHVLPTRARNLIHSNNPSLRSSDPNDGPTGPRHDQNRGGYFDLRVPVSAAQMLAAAAELRDVDRALRRMSPRWVRALFRPWWRAGWTNSDVLHALSHVPAIGGTRPLDRCPAEQLRRPDGWVRHRMSRWWTDAGPAAAPRRWETVRRGVEGEHGRAAGARLPYGAAKLQPEDLAMTPGERDAAAAAIVRRWAREMHERRNAPTPPEQIPDNTTRHRKWQEVCEQIRHRSPAPPPATPDPAASDPQDSQTTWKRALERARREGQAARPRRRRPRW
jgi:hypothetical protein